MMENEGLDIQDGALSVWEMFNSPMLTLLRNIDQAEPGLDSLMTSIINSTRDFIDVLVPRQQHTADVERKYSAFNKWLLGRLFYIQSVPELSRKIHELSGRAQIKILSLLFSNRASFFTDIYEEYKNCFNILIKQYENTDDQTIFNALEVQFLPSEEVIIPNTNLDFTPIMIKINNVSSTRYLIKSTMEILCQMIILTKDFEFKHKDDIIFSNVLFCLKNFDLDLKHAVIRFFTNILDYFGFYVNENYINEFFTIVEVFLITDNSDVNTLIEISSINEEFSNLMGVVKKQIGFNNKPVYETILNICKLLIEVGEQEIYDNIRKESSNFISNDFRKYIYSSKLKKICLEIVESIYKNNNSYNFEMFNRLLYLNEIPSFFVLTILSELDTYENFSNETNSIVLNKNSNMFSKIFTMFKETLNKICKYDSDLSSIGENLKYCINILKIFQHLRIEFYNKQQHSIFKRILDTARIEEKMQDSKNDCSLCIFSKEEIGYILNRIVNILKKLKSNTQISLCIEMAMSVTTLGWEISEKDEEILKAILFNKFYQNDKIDSLKMLLAHNLVMTNFIEMKDWSFKIQELLESLDLNNINNFSNVLKCVPMLIINNVLPPYHVITKYLQPAFSSNNESLLSDLLAILPVVVCLLHGHYITIQTKTEHHENNVEFNLLNVHSFHFAFVCLHCCSKMRSGSLKYVKKINMQKDVMILMRKSKPVYSDINNILLNLKSLFEKFLNARMYSACLNQSLQKMMLVFVQHSVFVPLDLCRLWTVDNIEDLSAVLEPFMSTVLNDDKFSDSIKTDVLLYCSKLILDAIKLSLHKNTSNAKLQDICLEAIKLLGTSKSNLVVLPALKLLIYFLMYQTSQYTAKASYYVKIICEHHDSTPNRMYHMYKKDLCRVMMSIVPYNYLVGINFASSISKVIQTFGFYKHRDFLTKEMDHALPFLIPWIVKMKKLRPIIDEIALLIPCSPSSFVIDAFPNIYTHIYLNEVEEDAIHCYKLMEEITKNSLYSLIKMHITIILNELLLQYCCGKENVLKACKWLASMDEKKSYTPDAAIPLTQVADFIQPRFLGVLAYLDNTLIQNDVDSTVKKKALQSFPNVLNLMGSKHMTPLKFKILATLRTALTVMKDFPDLNADAWNSFIRNVDTIALGPLLTTIFVSLIPLLPNSPVKVNSIFEYLLISNETLLSGHMVDLFFFENSDIDNKFKRIVEKHVERKIPNIFIEKVQWYMKYLKQDVCEVQVYALKCLHKLIKSQRTDLDMIIFGTKAVNPIIVELLEILIKNCREKDIQLADWSARCLGQLGALEPSLLPQRQALSQSSTSFALTLEDPDFAKSALLDLTRAFQFEKHTKNMDSYALAIQEILKTFEISPQGKNKDLWYSFPSHLQQIMQPLLSSRYTLKFPTNPTKIHPVFGSKHATTFNKWAFNWATQLIPSIVNSSIQKLLRYIQPALFRDQKTLMLFLPYIVLHNILSCDSNDIKVIEEEIMSVISIKSFGNESTKIEIPKTRIMKSLNLTPNMKMPLVLEEGSHIKCCKMVYNLIDFLNRWLREWIHVKNKSSEDITYLKVKTFTETFCKLTLAQGSFLCGELERALLYLEMYMEESSDHFNQQLSFLAEIYAVLNEPDSVAGIMRMKQSEPSLSELILFHEVTGQLQDAATCYEKYAQQGNMENERLQGMVGIYLALDQPFTALSLLQSVDSSDLATDALTAEPFWRLAMFDDLDRLLKKPNILDGDSWGVNIGHCLLALRTGTKDILQEKLKKTRFSVMRKLDRDISYTSNDESIYVRAYSSAIDLHVISEIHHVEEALFKIKDLGDADSKCSDIINDLVENWNLRLRLVKSSPNTIEPVLRMRRILLEQSKELLLTTHPKTASLLDNYIGKLWLQSAKFARKASIFQLAYIYVLNAEKYRPKELFIEKAKLYWMRGQQEPAFCTLKRGLEEHFPDITQLTPTDRKLCAKAKLLTAIYNDKTIYVDMDVNIVHYKDAVEVYRQWEKSLICLGAYYERVYAALSPEEKKGESGGSARAHALNCYGCALQHGHSNIYQSMPRMLSIWLDFEKPTAVTMSILKKICALVERFTEKLPLYLFFTAFSQIISRICHPIPEVQVLIKSIIIKLILAYPQHALWMMMSVIKSAYPQRIKRCQEILNDSRLSDPQMQKIISDFKTLAEQLIKLCNHPLPDRTSVTYISKLSVRSLPAILASESFTNIIMPHEQFIKIALPFNSKQGEFNFNPFPTTTYIRGVEDEVTILKSLQKPRKVTLLGSDGKKYIIMLKPKDDLRKDFRLMEFNAVVNRYLQCSAESRERRLYIRTYSVLPLNEECGIIQWIPNLLGLRPILLQLYRDKGLYFSPRDLVQFNCKKSESIERKREVFEKYLLPKHPPIFSEWFKNIFPDPHSWYQARTAYIRTTAVMSMVGYILGLGDRHGENILFDSTNGDSIHVDFNCLFNKGEEFEYPEVVPFRLTHNMQTAMGPLGYEGMYRKCCEITMRVLRAQTPTLMSVIRPFVYDPLVAWQKNSSSSSGLIGGEFINLSARDHLTHIEQRLEGMVRTKGKQFSLALSPEGQTFNLIQEATSVVNLCQMFFGWGPFL